MLFIFPVFGLFLLEIILLSRLVARAAGLIEKRKRKTVVRVAAACVHITAAVGILCICYSYFIEPYWIELVEVDIPTDKMNGSSLTIVQVSDMHCDITRRNEDEVVRIINDINPDIIVFTGDAVNDGNALPVFRETLRRMDARLGKFAVRGNVDYKYSNEDLFKDTGFISLDAGVEEISMGNHSFFIAGVSPFYYSDIPQVLKKVPPDKFCVFLHHHPHVVDELPPGIVDLSLCGHIHGGQVALPFYGAIITLSPTGKKYERGAYTVGETLLYVNRGIGMEGGIVPRIRFCARPEITIFRIHSRNDAEGKGTASHITRGDVVPALNEK